MLIYLLHEISKLIYIPGFVEIDQLVLIPFLKCKVSLAVKGLVVVVEKSSDPIEFPKGLGSLPCDCLS